MYVCLYKVYNATKFNFVKMRVLINSINPTRKHSASLIFFHGSGDTGENLISWIRFLIGKDLQFPHIKVIFPTAPAQSYTPLGGEISNVWFDRHSIDIKENESRQSMTKIYEIVHELINEEMKLGISANRIIVGGFSMGGALAMHTAFHLNTDLAGVFACSSFLNHDSIVYDTLVNETKTGALPELRMFHGDRDTLVPVEWGQKTFEKLRKLGVSGEFIRLPNTLHELKKKEILNIQDWILKKLTSSDV